MEIVSPYFRIDQNIDTLLLDWSNQDCAMCVNEYLHFPSVDSIEIATIQLTHALNIQELQMRRVECVSFLFKYSFSFILEYYTLKAHLIWMPQIKNILFCLERF